MSIRTELQALTAIWPTMTPRVLNALRAIDNAAAELDGLASPAGGERVRGGTTTSVVERAAGSLGPLMADRAAILASIEALKAATAHLAVVCDRYAPINRPAQCVGGAGHEWWSHRRTTLPDCTNWAAVGVHGTPNRGGLCDACYQAQVRHKRAA